MGWEQINPTKQLSWKEEKKLFFVDCAPGHVSSYCFVRIIFSLFINFLWFFSYRQAVNLDFTVCQMSSVHKNIDFFKSPLVTAVLIDNLHLRNHRRQTCHERYNPDLLKRHVPNANLICAEETESEKTEKFSRLCFRYSAEIFWIHSWLFSGLFLNFLFLYPAHLREGPRRK